MMIRALNCVTLLMAVSIFLAPWANAEDLSQEYLHGRWVIDEQNCGSEKAEFIEFRKDGTFECIRTGRTEIVGFWDLNRDIVDLHMVTSPAFFHDIHRVLKGHEGEYNYFQIKLLISNTSQKGFEAFGVLGDEYKRMTAVRCQ